MPQIRAAEVYLLEHWHKHIETPLARRNKIFREFVSLGIRGRWPYHAKAEDFEVSEEERRILDHRTHEQKSIAFWISDGCGRVLFTKRKRELREDEVEWTTDWREGELVRDFEESDALPERVYCLTAFDDPDDVEEARAQGQLDQTLWVSGVYWVVDEDLKIVWVDEFGETIREKVCRTEELEEGAEAFSRLKPFESTWWTDATRVGKYATDKWWR
ncbi:hypothetical protein PRZ48_013575 [Zasmidium cellare]|uniref:Uncharacterized protein n=1 Tax=Zasmidium cellare TaxID=395010 RepID=A0ABR0E1Y7_ZASCE|nr:hypothetical protein PRZ48_013575 [Zasmidium cellare]